MENLTKIQKSAKRVRPPPPLCLSRVLITATGLCYSTPILTEAHPANTTFTLLLIEM